MSSLSYQQKSLYGSLAANLIVYLPYFFYSFSHYATLGRIVSTITVLIAAQIILQCIIAAATRNRLTDERDRLILLRGYRAGYVTVITVMLLGMGGLWMHSALGQLDPSRMALHFLNVFFGILVIAEIVKTVTQIMAYRRLI